jgi:hypothetical protein
MDKLRPAIRLDENARPIVGEQGQTHTQMIKAQPNPSQFSLEDQRGFVMTTDPTTFLSRAEATAKLGLIAPIHSEDLADLQATAEVKGGEIVEEEKGQQQVPPTVQAVEGEEIGREVREGVRRPDAPARVTVTGGAPPAPPTAAVPASQLPQVFGGAGEAIGENWYKMMFDTLEGRTTAGLGEKRMMARLKLLYDAGKIKSVDDVKAAFGQPPATPAGEAPQAPPTAPEPPPTAPAPTELPLPGVAGPPASSGEPPGITGRPQPLPETPEQPIDPPLPQLNEQNGGVKPPPPGSTFAPDTPPGSDPDLVYALRTSNAFVNWWRRFWPRSLAILRKTPDSLVISGHGQFIASQQKWMTELTQQPWYRAFRQRSDENIIDLEHNAVTRYRAHLENGVDPKQARTDAINSMPPDVRDYMLWRESRYPLEAAWAKILDVDPPKYTGDPYIPRLTNEEGKAVFDLHPQMGNWGRQIRSTIGSFDESRTHMTQKIGIHEGTQYEPTKRAVWVRELVGGRLGATAEYLQTLKGTVLFDTPREALAKSPTGKIAKVRGFGGKDYYARTQEEAIFLEQQLNSSSNNSALNKMVSLANAYIRNPSLVNPLPHVTKNMFFKYLLARVGNFTFKGDTAEFKNATAPELLERFNRVMPFPETGERLPQIQAREIGTWAEKLGSGVLNVNKPSTSFIFTKADPAMRYSLWKSYVRKGMSDQEAANNVWIDLVRYDENSGGINFWKSIPLNFFVPWRTGTYQTLAKAFTTHPIRSLLYVGAVEYLREARYRATGRWTHLPIDYIDAPLAEVIVGMQKKGALKGTEGAAMLAATTRIFGPGGGQAPQTIQDVMEALKGDPQNRARIMNMFWGLSAIYNMPRDWEAFKRDGNYQHLVNLLLNASISEHSSLKYEPRRLMKWLPEWMPLMQKSQTVLQAEALQQRIEAKQMKSMATQERRSGVTRGFFQMLEGTAPTPEQQQMEQLERAAGIRRRKTIGQRAIGRP